MAAGGQYYFRPMTIDTFPKPGAIVLHVAGRTKEAVIDELLAAAEKSGQIEDVAAARTAVLERERLMSTGMQFGVAIPHGKLDKVDGLVTVLGVSDVGVDFGSLDGEPSRIFTLTLSPASRTGPHLRFLADMSILLRQDSVREAILSAPTPERVLQALAGMN